MSTKNNPIADPEFSFSITDGDTTKEIVGNTVVPIPHDKLATTKEIRELTKRGSDNFVRALYESIELREGHNGRTKDNPGFTIESLTELARSILSIGLQEPIGVDILNDGRIILTKGERRWRAIGIIRQWIKDNNLKELFYEGADKNKDIPTFEFVECFINPKSFDENDRIVAMLVENTGIPLEPIEQAEALMRLKNNGMSAAEIARKIPGMNPMQVSLRLSLAGLSSKEKELIGEGKISPTAAVKLSKQESDAEKRVEAIESAAEQGEKIKVKDTETEKPNEIESAADLVEAEQQEESTNPIKDGDLIDEMRSGAGDDPSMKGTSPKAPPVSTKDPAIKSVDQPDANEKDDRVTSGKSTAFDIVLKCIASVKSLDEDMAGKLSPKAGTFIYDLDKMLYDLKAILKK